MVYDLSKFLLVNFIPSTNCCENTTALYIKKVNSLIQIKKPNDILINKKKICGILQEIIFRNERKYLIVGIGINVSNSPIIDAYPTTFLNKHLNKDLNRLKLFQELRIMYEKNLHLFGA